MPDMAPPAFYRPADIARAIAVVKNGTFNLKDASGKIIDSLGVLPGEWLVIENGAAYTEIDDEAFFGKFDPIPGLDGYFARKGPVFILRQPVNGAAAEAFTTEYLRCTEDGTVLCALNIPLARQFKLLSGSVAPDPHLDVIRALRDELGRRPIYDPGVQADLHLYDVFTSGIAAEPVRIRADETDSGITPEDIPSLVSEVASFDNIPAPLWVPISKLPDSGIPQMIALRERLFGEMTDIALGRIQATLRRDTQDGNPLDEFIDWVKGSGEHRPLETQPDFSNLAPGYVAEVDRYARDGVEFLIVRDFMAAYVYAWPDQKPVPSPKP